MSTGGPNSDPKSNMPFGGGNFNPLANQNILSNLGSIPPNSLPPHFVGGGMDPDGMNYYNMPDMGQQEHLKKLKQKFLVMRDEIEKMEKNPELFKAHQLPLARVKKIMKSDEDVRMISAEAPVLFAKACEMFITDLTHRAWLHTEEGKRRTLQKNDIATCIANTDIFDFLVDIIPREVYTKNMTLRKSTNDSYLPFHQNYSNSAASLMGNIPIPNNMSYSMPPSLGMGINSQLVNNQSLFNLNALKDMGNQQNNQQLLQNLLMNQGGGQGGPGGNLGMGGGNVGQHNMGGNNQGSDNPLANFQANMMHMGVNNPDLLNELREKQNQGQAQNQNENF